MKPPTQTEFDLEALPFVLETLASVTLPLESWPELFAQFNLVGANVCNRSAPVMDVDDVGEQLVEHTPPDALVVLSSFVVRTHWRCGKSK